MKTKAENQSAPVLTLMYLAERGADFPGRRTATVRVQSMLPAPLHDRAYGFYVKGDCMEARDIHDGDLIIVDPARMPRPMKGDVCVCRVDYTAPVMVKEYISPLGGGVHNVTEHRFREKGLHFDEAGRLVMEQAYFASKIYGAVVACYPPDDLTHPRWEIDASELPAELQTEPGGKSEVEYVGRAMCRVQTNEEMKRYCKGI